jgi:hypothetical protein
MTFGLALLLALTPGVAASAPGVAVYDYSEPDEGLDKDVRLAIPADLATVRGIFVHTNANGGDTRERYRQPVFQAFAALHGLAFLGAHNFNSHPTSVTVLQHALARFAADSGHRELLNAPFVVYGFSAGAGFANRLLNTLPGRVVASASLSAAMRTAGEPEVCAVPVCQISGQQENVLNPYLDEVMKLCRPRGARWSWLTVEGLGHAERDQWALALLFLDHCIKLRCPPDADPRQGPVALRPLDEAAGWLADMTTCRAGVTTIAPVGGLKTEPGHSSWLPDQDLAFVYRAYASFGPRLALTSPQPAVPVVLTAGAGLPVTVDDGALPGWQHLALYDGAAKLAELTQGPARFALGDLKPGVHALHVLATDAAGQPQVSKPVLVEVRPGPAGTAALSPNR